MQQPHEDAQIMTLREHLLSSQAQQTQPPAAQQQQQQQPAQTSPGHEHHIDPAISSAAYHMDGLDDSPRGGKSGRELSTSKRAAQNRAAQRAFRQRKEAYINSLQEKVKEYEGLVANYKAIQQENFQLREYIIQLQSKLIGEVPPAPPDIDLENPPERPAPPSPAARLSPPLSAIEPRLARQQDGGHDDHLRAAAAAAAHAAANEGSSEEGDESAGRSDHKRRRTQAEPDHNGTKAAAALLGGSAAGPPVSSGQNGSPTSTTPPSIDSKPSARPSQILMPTVGGTRKETRGNEGQGP